MLGIKNLVIYDLHWHGIILNPWYPMWVTKSFRERMNELEIEIEIGLGLARAEGGLKPSADHRL